MERLAVRLIVHGRVQGVGYRWWTVREARSLGVNGWVRNLADGGVEILAIGARGAVTRLADACRRGPSAAGVDGIDQATAEDDGSSGFDARPTANE
jgi:acylphosphatase